jgi:putative iron-regulated protein
MDDHNRIKPAVFPDLATQFPFSHLLFRPIRTPSPKNSRMRYLFLGVVFLSILGSCSKDDDDNSPAPPEQITKQDVVNQYAKVVFETYNDALASAKDMQAAINSFADDPTDDNFTAAKNAWLEARAPYGRSEAFRFYGGPIDVDPGGPEGLMNSWPMDEAYVDYVDGDADAGIINDPTTFPSIDETVLEAANQSDAEEEVSTGWHAIEFLLWGQDLDAAGTGHRPYTDYIVGAGGTAANQDRRGQYLKAVTNLLVENLQSLVDQWKEGGSYRTQFTASTSVENSLQLLLTGIGKFASGELGGERMKAYITKEQEDEHSCFSDNTTNDHIYGEEGIINVYYGKYTKVNGDVIDGPGIDDLVKAANPAANDGMVSAIDAAYAAVKAIPAPFDQAILATSDNKVEDASHKVQAEGDQIVVVAQALGYTVTL